MTQRQQYSGSYKAKVVLELFKEEKTFSEICSQYSVHPTQASNWKKKAKEILEKGFEQPTSPNSVQSDIKRKEELIDELYKQVGQLKIETDWLKKN